MMKLKIAFFFLILSCFQTLQAQQWVQKQYTYDSLLNVKYGVAADFYGDADTLHMDVYLPSCDNATNTATRPLLLLIHGGAFLTGNKNDASIQTLCKSFAKRGYVTASIDYRLGFVADDNARQCNFPDYACAFATDSAEWVRAYYRSIQDAKGALRFLVNRNDTYKIDINNIFVAGESAGAFTALGTALMDTEIERPSATYQLSNVPLPNILARKCTYNLKKTFAGATISRPDLGSIEGAIEPSNIKYTIKGVGNIFGGMYSDLLKNYKLNATLPAIYSFHQPCDIVVPIDSNYVYWGLSWCLINGYNCNGVANNQMMIYGARVFTKWNEAKGYGYTLQNEFTSKTFSNNVLGPGGCLDQVSSPCHAYDNPNLRENNMATFFAKFVTTATTCLPNAIESEKKLAENLFKIYPNPVEKLINIESINQDIKIIDASILDTRGNLLLKVALSENNINTLNTKDITSGLYYLKLTDSNNKTYYQKFVKQ